MKAYVYYFRILTIVLLGALYANLPVHAQSTFLETFEDEAIGSTTFSQSGTEFIHNFHLARYSSPYGYQNSYAFLELKIENGKQTATGSISINISKHPGMSFRINDFAGYLDGGTAGTNPVNGIMTVSGTPVGESIPVSTNIEIRSKDGTLPSGQNRDGIGNVGGLNFQNTPLAGKFFTKLDFTISDPEGSILVPSYLVLDHITFTTQVAPTNQYSINDVGILEGSEGFRNLTFTITRSSTTAAGSVTVQSGNGTAQSGSDYVALAPTVVNFSAGGPSSMTVNVTILGDTDAESDETFQMVLSSPQGGVISKETGIGTILDDDNILETFEDEELGNNVTTFQQRTFAFSTTGDFLVSSGTNLGAGNCFCGSKALDTRVGNGGTNGEAGGFTITTPGISFNLHSIDVFPSQNDGTSGATSSSTITFRGIRADGLGEVTHTANVGPISGNNYQTVNFQGTSFAGVQILAVYVSLGPGLNYIALDNLRFGTKSYVPVPLLSINDVSIVEGDEGDNKTATFTITRTENTTSFTVKVSTNDVTASAGSDYQAFQTTLSFPAGGALSQTVNITVIGDNDVEVDEVFEVKLSEATNGVNYLKSTGKGIILDNESITETFEDDIHLASSFTEKTVSFGLTGPMSVNRAETFGTNSSDQFLHSAEVGSGESAGKITITTPGTGFLLLKLDAWVGNDYTNSNGYVTFTGTLYDGSTISVVKNVIATSYQGDGWHQNITFAGTPLENQVLISLEFTLATHLRSLDLDNFTFAPVPLFPKIQITSSGEQAIGNNVEASTSNGTDFGSHCARDVFIENLFTIKNTGTAPLTLSESSTLELTGTDAAHFAIREYPEGEIAPGSSTSFAIRYQPTAPGNHTAAVVISSNDGNNAQYIVNIKGATQWNVVIESSPIDQTMGGNGTNALGSSTYEVTVNSAHTFQWQYRFEDQSYAPLTESEVFKGVSTRKLTIDSPPVSYHNAQFRVAVTGCNTENSLEATLKIISPSAILPDGELTPIEINSGDDAGWTYYTDGDNVGFAINWGGNSAKATAKVTITSTQPTEMESGNEKALYAMGRYWNVESDELENPVSIRFYFLATEKSNVTSLAEEFAELNNKNFDGFRWFKTSGKDYDPNSTISSAGIGGTSVILSGEEFVLNDDVSSVEFTDITSFSGGTGFASTGFGNDVLPVDLISFTLHKTDDAGVEARWTTRSETNSGYFLLERSADARYFESIGSIEATGTTGELKHYSYRDTRPLPGINYYRITEIADDGSATRFPIRSISLRTEIRLAIYPNPVKNEVFTIATEGDTPVVSITLRTLAGRRLPISSKALSNNLSQVVIQEKLPTAIYLLTIQDASGAETTRKLLVN